MKTSIIRLGAIAAALSFLVGSMAYAATPTLSLYATGNGDTVQVSVYGDPNSAVWLYKNFGGQQYLGMTSSAGYLSTNVSSSTNGLTPGSYVYVLVNNQSSAQIPWPSYNTGGYYGGSIYLSQTNLNLNIGQSASISISGGTQPYTQFQNGTNGMVFQSIISGGTLTVTGTNSGSGSLTVCSASGNTGSGCATLYVSVNGYNGYPYPTPYPTYNPYPTPYPAYGSPINFSQSTVTLNQNQSATVTIYGGSGSYYIGYNSASGTLQASINGSTLTLSAYNNGSLVYPYSNPFSSAGLVVCSSSGSCGGLTVNMNSSIYPTNTGWTFCANENQPCNFYGTQMVRYGANGQYVYRTVTGGTPCSNAVFGDPAFGVVKQCYYGGTGYGY